MERINFYYKPWTDGPHDPSKYRKWRDEQRAKSVAEINPQIAVMNNNQLFEEYSELLPGDDYDGCFTDAASVAMDLLAAELRHRLLSAGFLQDED